jgi:hypothetical protein
MIPSSPMISFIDTFPSWFVNFFFKLAMTSESVLHLQQVWGSLGNKYWSVIIFKTTSIHSRYSSVNNDHLSYYWRNQIVKSNDITCIYTRVCIHSFSSLKINRSPSRHRNTFLSFSLKKEPTGYSSLAICCCCVYSN